MPLYEVCIVESRDLVFVIEADDEDEAKSLAMDIDTPDATRDSFRERIFEWIGTTK